MNFCTWNVGLRYPKEKDREKEFETRFVSVILEIKKLDVDVICLQEVTLKKGKKKNKGKLGITPFEVLLGDYDYIIHETTDTGCPDGNLILIRKTKFKILDGNKKFEFKYENKTFLAKAIHVNMLHLESNLPMCLINVHLKAGYNSGEDRRIFELACCLEKLDSSHFVCICGDFNDDLDEGRKLTNLLNDNKFNFEYRPKTCCHWSKTLNEICYSSFDRAVVRGLDIAYIDDERNNELVKNNTNIPNDDMPSDHLPIKFVLSFEN